MNKQIGLNQLYVNDSDNMLPLQFIYSGLIKFSSSEDKALPDLAEKWDVSDDFKSIRFTLRDKAYFHDGHPVTTEDVKFTYEKYMDPTLLKAFSYYSFIKSIERIGDKTILFTFNKVFSSPEYYFSLWILPSHLKDHEDNQHPIGTGPYLFNEMNEDGSVLLHRNEMFYAEKGKPEYLFFRSYPNKQALWSGFMRREVDLYMKPDYEQLSMVEKTDWCNTIQLSSLKCYMLLLNCEHIFLKDVRVRILLESMINKDEIIQKIFKGHAKPIDGPLLNNPPGYFPEKISIEDSLKAFNALGFYDTDADGILEKEGRPFVLTLSVNNELREYLNISKVLKTQFKKAGIRVEIVVYKNPEKWANKIYSDHAFDLALFEKTIGFKERSLIYWLKEMGDKAFVLEQSNLFSEKYWKMQQSKDPIFKNQMLTELLDIIHNEKRCIFLIHPLNYYAFNDRLDFSGIIFAPFFYMRDLIQINFKKGAENEVPNYQKRN